MALHHAGGIKRDRSAQAEMRYRAELIERFLHMKSASIGVATFRDIITSVRAVYPNWALPKGSWENHNEGTHMALNQLYTLSPADEKTLRAAAGLPPRHDESKTLLSRYTRHQELRRLTKNIPFPARPRILGRIIITPDRRRFIVTAVKDDKIFAANETSTAVFTWRDYERKRIVSVGFPKGVAQ